MMYSFRTPKEDASARLLVMYGHPKQGKSTICSMLEGALILDLKHEYDHLSGIIVECDNFTSLCEIIENIKKSKERYPFIVIDNATWLVDIVKPYALRLFKDTPSGKGTTFTDVLDAPFGAGYLWIRVAFLKIIDALKELTDSLILIGHIKETQALGLEGDLDLPGSLKTYVMKEADSVCRFYREEGKNLMDFNGNRVIAQSRVPHLRGKVITIGESDENGKITAYWERIYPSLKKKQSKNKQNGTI